MDFKDIDNPFAVLADSLPELVWSTRADGYHDYFNKRWYEFTGLTVEECMGDGWQRVINPEDVPQVKQAWREAVAAKRLYECEFRVRNVAGAYEWVISRATPVLDPQGEIARWFGASTNINAQKSAEEALHILENQYRLALDAARLGTWRLDFSSGELNFDEGACALYGFPAEGLYRTTVDSGLSCIHPDDRAKVQARLTAVSDPASEGRYENEYRIVRPDGSTRWIRSNGQAIFSSEAGPRRAVCMFGVMSDITERHAAEEAQHLLARELNHRVKNLFAIANGMVSMTARTAKDPKEMANALRGRLGALARAHDLVQPAPMPGQPGPVSAAGLPQLVDAVLEPYRHSGSDRIVTEGPDLRVGSSTTTSLALVLHELATNASKYGSLSKSEGRLTIRWTVQDGTLDLVWTETGGPPLSSPPSFEGFGTQLSQRTIAGQLGGTLHRDWRPEGLCVSMTLPVDRLGG